MYNNIIRYSVLRYLIALAHVRKKNVYIFTVKSTYSNKEKSFKNIFALQW